MFFSVLFHLRLPVGVEIYFTQSQSVSFSTAIPSDVSLAVATTYDVTVGSALIVGESGYLLSNVTLLEGTAYVKVTISTFCLH